jgi:hypothetical protein
MTFGARVPVEDESEIGYNRKSARCVLRCWGESAPRRRPAIRQQAEVCFAALKGVFGMGETLASTLVGLVRRIGLSDRLVGWVAFQALGCGVPPTTQRPLADKRAPF